MIDRDITKEKIPTIAENNQSYLKLREDFLRNIEEQNKRLYKIIEEIKNDMHI